MKQYFVYFMSNKSNSVLYVGVTNDLERRVLEHKEKRNKGFTEKYNCNKLVFFENTNDISVALLREKQLKNWCREWKNTLIEIENSGWKDLSVDWYEKN